MTTYTKHEKLQDYGRIGGLQTFLRYGREYMRTIAKRGGRPRLRQLTVPKTDNNIKEGMANNRFLASQNLKALKELYAAKKGAA